MLFNVFYKVFCDVPWNDKTCKKSRSHSIFIERIPRKTYEKVCHGIIYATWHWRPLITLAMRFHARSLVPQCNQFRDSGDSMYSWMHGHVTSSHTWCTTLYKLPSNTCVFWDQGCLGGTFWIQPMQSIKNNPPLTGSSTNIRKQPAFNGCCHWLLFLLKSSLFSHNWWGCKMDGWMKEFNATFAQAVA